MAAIANFFHELFSNIPTIKFSDALDILIVAFIIYQLINMIHSTSASRIAKGIILLLLLTLLTDTFHLYTMNFILSKILEDVYKRQGQEKGLRPMPSYCWSV